MLFNLEYRHGDDIKHSQGLEEVNRGRIDLDLEPVKKGRMLSDYKDIRLPKGYLGKIKEGQELG